MTMTRLVILANSLKRGDLCLAGIDLETGKWVRPVTTLDDGRVPKKSMKIFPALLDVVEIPLAATGPDFGFECENRTILPGPWRNAGALTMADLDKYIEQPRVVLHNQKKSVAPSELRQKPFEERRTLQLIRVENFRVYDARAVPFDKPNWKGIVLSGGQEIEAGITDPVYIQKLGKGHVPSPSCVLTMSLSMPYAPPGWTGAEALCWKLIAAVLEISEV